MIGAKLRPAPRYAPWSDAVVRRALAELKVFTDWCTANSVTGYLGEIGWPWSQDNAAWNNVARAYLQQANKLGLFYSLYASSGHLHTDILGQYTDLGGAGDPRVITTVRPNTRPSEAYARRSKYSVTIPDADFGANTIVAGGLFSNVNPGTVGTDYFYPSSSDFAAAAARGVKIVRLCFQWERLQPTLGAALDSAELTRLTTALTAIGNAGMQSIVTPHNFGGYKIGTDANTRTQYYISTDTTLPLHINHFADLWARVSAALNGHSAVLGYALMNEPTGITPISGAYGPNLLGGGTFETNAESWSGTVATVARSTAQAHGGSASLASTATGSGNAGAFSPNFAITANGGYAATCYMRAGSIVRKGAINIDWHAAGGAYLSSASGTQINLSTSAWTQLSVAGTAPSNAALANITIKAYSSLTGEVAYIDDVVCQASTVTTAPQMWEAISQAAVTAIRGAADSHVIYVPGYDFSHAHNWATNHPAPWITDTDSNFGYEAHHYWDTDHSGRYVDTYAQELVNATGAGY